MSEFKEPPVALQSQQRWSLIAGVAIVVALTLILIFLLMQATQNWDRYEQYYTSLFIINSVVAAFLFLVIGWFAWRLAKRVKQGKFGSQLLVKLAAIFALVGIVPGILIYGVSYQFVTRSIEAWFDDKVEGALEAGLNLTRTSLDSMAQELTTKSKLVATEMSSIKDENVSVVLEKWVQQTDFTDMVLWSSNTTPIASAGASRYQLNPEKPNSIDWRRVKSSGIAWQIEGLDEGLKNQNLKPRIQVLVQVNQPKLDLRSESRVLQVIQNIPAALVSNAQSVLEASREYQEKSLAREGLKRMYVGTLTLTLFLAVLGAVLLAVLLGNQLARPLLLLAEGVREVAEGDLSPKAVLHGRDELDGLTRSFARMTQQLLEARVSVEQSMMQVDLSRAHLQTILDNMTAGVILLSNEGVVLSSNPAATRILRVPMAVYEHQSFLKITGMETFGQQVLTQFDQFVGEQLQHGFDHWQQSFDLEADDSEAVTSIQQTMGKGVTLVARGAVLPSGEWLLVFDDISEIVSAQRAQAWGEVARRLAHEIKNPLTPIQLSAERLAMKLEGKLQQPEMLILDKSVKTIVDQVDAMKRLVNEFRDYARLPQAQLQPIDLNQLVSDILYLYEAENDTLQSRIQIDLAPDLPKILGDYQQIRQVIHNLLQNAQDATPIEQDAHVVLRTDWRDASHSVRLSVIDGGTGFPDAVLKRAFEPYVTTKSKGTGLGLAVVKKIADDHGARIDFKNRLEDGQVVGAQVSLSFQVAQ